MKLALLLVAASAFAQPKQVPPAGIAIPAAYRAELQAGLDHLRAAIAALKTNPLLPDVEIYSEAVRYALQYDEFFKPDEVAKARVLLRHGEERAAQLAAGKSPWTTAPGLIVRGYVSKIDKSVQPYGLVVPPSYSADAPRRWRLDTWFHGRNETLNEINFLTDREKNKGEFTPPDTIVLHLYGRFCNASKFAGEVDFFEALADVKRHYAIDENRILVRGFSMGGASAWHIGAHFAGLWAAVAPGAGFSETMQYQKLHATGPGAPPEWEQKLFHLYDAVDYAANLYNTTVVAYNGELDPQKQAADMMEKAMAAEGMHLTRIVGPQTQHKYHPESKTEIERILGAAAEKGRDPHPRTVKFTTWTLAYDQMKWVTVDALGEHWQRARVEATATGDNAITVTTSNVTALTLDFGKKATVTIDGQALAAPPMAHFRKKGAQWTLVGSAAMPGLHKVHRLQGPIDDAFMDSFVFVTPSGTASEWVKSEEAKAIAAWRTQFRGEPQVREDREITAADIANSNLVLWGDPKSNRVLARIIDKLPVKWTAETVTLQGHSYPSATIVPVLICPNPLNPKKYVVLNSGFTFSAAAAGSNSRQTPKLPDWALLNRNGAVESAGFFNEDWK